MPKVLMIGPSRAGKSYYAAAFQNMGLPAVDAEEVSGLLGWYADETGERAPKPLGATKGWYHAHHWLVSRQPLEQSLVAHPDIIMFFHSWNILDVINLFDEAYFMYVNEAELQKRFQIIRPGHVVQRDPTQIAFMLDRHRQRLADARRLGIPIVDATQTPKQLYDQIKAHRPAHRVDKTGLRMLKSTQLT